MSKASNKAYYLGEEIGTHDTIRVIVFNYIELNPYCKLEEIGERLKIKEKSVSGRITELKQKGLIYELEGNSKSIYRVSNNKQEVKEMQKRMKVERYEKWVNCGINNKYFTRHFADSFSIA